MEDDDPESGAGCGMNLLHTHAHAHTHALFAYGVGSSAAAGSVSLAGRAVRSVTLGAMTLGSVTPGTAPIAPAASVAAVMFGSVTLTPQVSSPKGLHLDAFSSFHLFCTLFHHLLYSPFILKLVTRMRADGYTSAGMYRVETTEEERGTVRVVGPV
jgi:hypothetical protein